MKLIFYPVLNKRSKLALKRQKKRFGHSYRYIPRMQLVKRLMSQFGMTEDAVRDQLAKEREFILKYPNYYP